MELSKIQTEECLDALPSRRKRIILGIAIFVALFLVWFIPWVPKLYLGSIDVLRLDAKGKPFHEMVGPSTKNWVEIDKVSKNFLNAVIVSEDGKFYHHHGIDLGEIYASYHLNRKKGRYVRGASTITQQVVKMTCLSREKTIIRKLREITGSLLLEMIMSKKDILEWYINLTEFGGGIYGIKPAGQYYFKTQPQLLTIEQSIALATVIPNPNKWSAGLRKKDLTEFGQKRFFCNLLEDAAAGIYNARAMGDSTADRQLRQAD